MKARFTAANVALAVLALLVAAVAGVAAGAVMFADPTPDALQDAKVAASAPVTAHSFDDKRTVQVALTLGADTALIAPASGRITGLSCQSGGQFTSGGSDLSIDGRRIVNLATTVPLWRDVRLGDKGEDVAAIQRELSRLGYAVNVNGTAGAQTFAAVTDLFAKAGAKDVDSSSIPVGRVLWLPRPDVTVSACNASTGANVAAGEKFATLPSTLAGAAITRLPDGALPGERILTIDGSKVPVDAAGRVTDPDALAVIAASSSYAEAVIGKSDSVKGSYTLAQPVGVSVVPPGSLFDIDGDAACVADGGRAFAVRIVASELGRSFVTFDSANPPAEVDMTPDDSLSCR